MNWDIGFILTFLGTFITAISLFFVFKFRTKPRIVYLINSFISPIKIVKSINDIQIQYKNKPITENLFLLNVTFINAGNKDIDQSEVHKDLSIVLPNSFNWLNHSIINKSRELDVSLKNDKNTISLAWDLLKPGESFTVEALIEYSGENISEDRKKLSPLTFDYRIKDINTIEKIDKDKLISSFTLVLSILSMLLLGMVGYALIQKYYTPKDDTKFLVTLSSKPTKEIKGLYFESLNDKMIIKDDKKNDLDTINYTDSTLTINVKASSIKVDPSYIIVTVGLLLIISSIIGLLFIIRRFLNDYSIKKILNTKIKDGELL